MFVGPVDGSAKVAGWWFGHVARQRPKMLVAALVDHSSPFVSQVRGPVPADSGQGVGDGFFRRTRGGVDV